MDLQVKAYLERQSIIKNYLQLMVLNPEELKSKLNVETARLNQIENSTLFSKEEIKQQAEPIINKIFHLRSQLYQAENVFSLPVNDVQHITAEI